MNYLDSTNTTRRISKSPMAYRISKLEKVAGVLLAIFIGISLAYLLFINLSK